MMALRVNSHLLSVLENYEVERLNAILSWLTPTDDSLPSLIEPDANHLEIQPMVPLSVLNTVEAENQDSLSVHELVHFSLLDEFGPTLSGKPAFVWLSQKVSQRIQGQLS